MSRTRGTWNTKGTWFAGVALAGVIVLTAYAALGGDGDEAQSPAKGGAVPSVSGSASPEATYAPPQDWTEPERWTALPRGQRPDERGSQVGFPHTAEGAVAMAAAANNTRIEGEKSTADEQLRIYHSYAGKGDKSGQAMERVELAAGETDKALAQDMGVGPGQPLPSGAYVRSQVVGYKVIKKSPDEVSVWLLGLVVQKNGETKKEESSYTRTLLGVQWQDGDWKLTADAIRRAQQDVTGQAQPPMVAPGDEEFNAGGWTAIREAS
ncbi:hypothetical protein OG280_41300 (plasmid) [Streptomyces virginiae]|uniref:hypothetical protein n=1 Tax=Streptomyces virginiae TaxID=1961 RepID=UPI002DD7CFA3|nr:hypothetical protein [Streptomyces virginiae]WSC82773.1 hypothetical protein OHA56_40960 [Streptomyces virginiae]